MRWLTPAVALSSAALITIGLRGQDQTAAFVREIPWYGRGVWLRVDTHTHTRFTDGSRTADAIASRATALGCDAIAITDHGDRNLRGASAGYFQMLDDARAAHQKIVIIGGMEWNIPPDHGSSHVVVLAPPPREKQLAILKREFDDESRDTRDPELAEEGLRWIDANLTDGDTRPVAIFEHPSRFAVSSMDVARSIRSWRNVNDVVIGFAGAPGHQGSRPIGVYEGRERPIDRWDPAAARVGDAWDTLLAEGLDVWGAYAPSDFHTDALADRGDYWPCQFAETWVDAPERSAAGVLRGLRAGHFFADHGRIVRDVELRVAAPGLPRPAVTGETITAAAGSKVTVTLEFDVPATAWRPGANHVDALELIAVTRDGARTVAHGAPAANGPALTFEMEVPEGGAVFRARGFSLLETGTRLAFYTNPVRIAAR